MFLSQGQKAKEWICFPRVCGDVPQVKRDLRTRTKFSPRMRGCSGYLSAPIDNPIVFPAYAGMFRHWRGAACHDLRFPRVCGDVPQKHKGMFFQNKFSPRMRGCSEGLFISVKGGNVFPAYAGMFRRFDQA